MYFIDETGNRYGKLIVLSRGDNTKHGHVTWLCECDCGRYTTVSGYHLRQGATKSCGCTQRHYEGPIKITGEMRVRSDSGAIEWYICSRNLSDWLLERFELRSPKSKNMPPVPSLNKQLMPHFIRGFWDGDGCFFLTTQLRACLIFSSADRGFLQQINRILPARSSVYENTTGYFDWKSSCKETIQTNLDWMWCNGKGFHLDRKWEKAGFIKD